MPIFESKALTAAFIASMLSFAPYYFFSCKEYFRITDARRVRIFFFFWMAIFTFEYYFLGPYSFVENTTEGNLNVTLNHYLTHNYDGGMFSHQFAGGQDVYTLLFGKHFFNIERILIAVFPLWISIWLHKIFVGFLGFVGTYLLVRRVAPNDIPAAVALSAIFPVCHVYLLNFSSNWNPGFSALPIIVYLTVFCSGDKQYFRKIFLAALILTPADPIHVFPALAVAIIGAVIVFEGAKLWRVAVAFIFLTLCSIANWHEVLFAFSQNVALATRGEGFGGQPRDFAASLLFGVEYLVTSMPLLLALLVGSIVVFVWAGDAFLWRALFIFMWPLLAYTLTKISPWQLIKLPFLDHLSHYYMLLSWTALIPLAAGRALAIASKENAWPIARLKPHAVVLAAALAALTWNKALNLGILVWFGGQSGHFAHETLRDNSWKPKEDFRVITLFEAPNANIVSGFYGLDTFDGQLNFNQVNFQDYWFSIVHRDPSHGLTTRAGSKWQNWNGRSYAVEGHLRLDLLGIANVRYIISALPLQSDKIKPIVVPTTAEQVKRRPESFQSQLEFIKFRLRRIFDPGKHFVYELAHYLPRLFAADSIEWAPEIADSEALHNRIAVSAPNGTVIISRNEFPFFDGLGKLRNVSYTRITDGYQISVDAPEGGVLVINNTYLPYWKALTAEGRQLKIVSANAIHMAVAVPKGTKQIRMRYHRPLLREKIPHLFP